MNTRNLRSFIEIARTKSISRAALNLSYAQSTLFEHIRALETEFDIELYKRVSHGIVLTPRGKEFYQFAIQFLALYEEMLSKFKIAEQETLKVSSSETTGVVMMRELINAYTQKYPEVKTDYQKMTTDVALLKVSSGICDIGFVCEAELNSEDVDIQYLCKIPLIFVANSKYPAVKTGAGREKPKYTLIGTCTRTVVEKLLNNIGLSFEDIFNSVLNIGDISIVKQLVLENHGIAMIPKVTVKEELRKGDLSRIPGLMGEVHFNVYIITQRKTRLSQATKNMIKLSMQLYGSEEKN
jgi:DNA-binding transcriptional LysR family regulator